MFQFLGKFGPENSRLPHLFRARWVCGKDVPGITPTILICVSLSLSLSLSIYTSNGRFAVDREFEYMELVSRRGLGELFGPPGELWPPWGGRIGPPWGGPKMSSAVVNINVSIFR